MTGTEWGIIALIVVVVILVVGYKYDPGAFSPIMGPTWVRQSGSGGITTGCRDQAYNSNSVAATVADCQAACIADPKCQAFYHKPSTQTCWKKGTPWCAGMTVNSTPCNDTDPCMMAYTPRAGSSNPAAPAAPAASSGSWL